MSNTPVREKWRPSLGLVIFTVLASVAALPLVGLFALFSTLRVLFGWAGHHEAKQGTLAIRKTLTERLSGTVAALGPSYTRSGQSGRIVTTPELAVVGCPGLWC
jgi:hypothetical protein